MRLFGEDTLLAAIAAASIAAVALTACESFRNGAEGSREFQSLLRGLGLGCQSSLAHGVAWFDPRLQGGDAEAFDPAPFAGEHCVWHPLTIFPAPAMARAADRPEQ